MFALPQFDPVRWQPKTNETPFAYWASVTPYAPLFGVRWRFAPDALAGEIKPEAKTSPSAEPMPFARPKPELVVTKPAPVEAAPAPQPSNGPDDLKRIKGIGPKLNQKLNEAGVTTFAQIAAWTEHDVDTYEAMFGELPGRIERDAWISQAKTFAAP